MAKKKQEEEHENHERWLVSYADFITLLFAFFVVMYSVSKVDNKRLSQTAASIKWALHFKGTGGLNQMPVFEGPPSEGGCLVGFGESSPAGPEVKQELARIKRRLEKRLTPFLSTAHTSRAVAVEVEGKNLVVRLAASHFFDPAFAALRPEALPVLDAVASELADLKRAIRVEGHTDSGQIHSVRYRDNWELSAARAARVVSYLQDAQGIDPTLLTAAGFGSTRPVASNETVEGREQNRRIELVVEISPGGALAAAP